MSSGVDGWPEVWRLGLRRTAQPLVAASSFLTWKAPREQSELSEEEAVAAVPDGIERALMNWDVEGEDTEGVNRAKSADAR